MENRELSLKQHDELMHILEMRFNKNMNRHNGVKWEDIFNRIVNSKGKMYSLYEMEITGGEPDVVSLNSETNEIFFVDCSEQSPAGRRNICYDRKALEQRKNNKPTNSATDMAFSMGIEILTEHQYRKLQEFGNFDTKTSSWVKTPENIRDLGGAIFCDRRYDTVFVYHNGADSYYSARGFRGCLNI